MKTLAIISTSCILALGLTGTIVLAQMQMAPAALGTVVGGAVIGAASELAAAPSVDVNTRREDYRRSGWARFETAAPPCTEGEPATARARFQRCHSESRRLGHLRQSAN